MPKEFKSLLKPFQRKGCFSCPAICSLTRSLKLSKFRLPTEGTENRQIHGRCNLAKKSCFFLTLYIAAISWFFGGSYSFVFAMFYRVTNLRERASAQSKLTLWSQCWHAWWSLERARLWCHDKSHRIKNIETEENAMFEKRWQFRAVVWRGAHEYNQRAPT